jgi:ankyrin repeat protein
MDGSDEPLAMDWEISDSSIPVPELSEREVAEILASLIDDGEVAMDDDIDGSALLLHSAKTNDIEQVYHLLNNGVNVDATDNDGHTAFEHAIRRGHNVVATMLAQKRALSSGVISLADMAFLQAVGAGLVDAVSLMLEHYYANVNAANSVGQASLICAALNGHKRVVELLLANGASVNAVDNEGNTALMWASLNGHNDIVAVLLENGANVNTVNANGSSPLMWASFSGQIEVVRLLLRNNASVNDSNAEGDRAVTRAFENGHNDVVRLLLENGAVLTYFSPSTTERIFIRPQQIMDNDVLCGRMNRRRSHPGNARFLHIIRENRAQYRAYGPGQRRMKTALVKQIVNEFQGRFVAEASNWNDESERYHLLTEREARKRASQSFRDSVRRIA